MSKIESRENSAPKQKVERREIANETASPVINENFNQQKPFISTRPPDSKPFISTRPPDSKPFISTRPPDSKPFIGTRPPDSKPFIGTFPPETNLGQNIINDSYGIGAMNAEPYLEQEQQKTKTMGTNWNLDINAGNGIVKKNNTLLYMGVAVVVVAFIVFFIIKKK